MTQSKVHVIAELKEAHPMTASTYLIGNLLGKQVCQYLPRVYALLMRRSPLGAETGKIWHRHGALAGQE